MDPFWGKNLSVEKGVQRPQCPESRINIRIHDVY